MKKEKMKAKKGKRNWISRRNGIWLMVIGFAMQFINIITYGLWGIDIDIFGALIFIIGLIVLIVGWKR